MNCLSHCRSPRILLSQRRGLSRGQGGFLGLLVCCGALLIAGLTFKSQIARLFRTNVAAEARRYLKEQQVRPLSDDLHQVLQTAEGNTVPTQQHPLQGKKAPNFTLSDALELPTTLDDKLGQGCVVLVFYYGYHCNHCVGQLFAVNDDLARFHELGAEVLAISADPPEETRKRYEEYGKFQFPVLSDPDNLTAAQYGVYAPASGAELERQQHGTFVIDRYGIVRWCNFGDDPFTDNRTLLWEIAQADKRARD